MPRPRKANSAESLIMRMLSEKEQEVKAEIAALIQSKPIGQVLALLGGKSAGRRPGRPPKGAQLPAAQSAGRKRAKRRSSAQMAKVRAEQAARLKVRKQFKMLKGPIPADKKQAFQAAVKAELARG